MLTRNTLTLGREFWGIKFSLAKWTPQSHHRLLLVFWLGNCVNTKLGELRWGLQEEDVWGGGEQLMNSRVVFWGLKYCRPSRILLISLGPGTKRGLGWRNGWWALSAGMVVRTRPCTSHLGIAQREPGTGHVHPYGAEDRSGAKTEAELELFQDGGWARTGERIVVACRAARVLSRAQVAEQPTVWEGCGGSDIEGADLWSRRAPREVRVGLSSMFFPCCRQARGGQPQCPLCFIREQELLIQTWAPGFTEEIMKVKISGTGGN